MCSRLSMCLYWNSCSLLHKSLCLVASRSMSQSSASTLDRATLLISSPCSASLRYCHSRSMWSHRASISFGAHSFACSLIVMCCLTYEIHFLPIRRLSRLSHPIVSFSLNASFGWFRLLSYVGGHGVLIAPPFGVRMYPCKPFFISVQKSFGSFQCVIDFLAFANDSSRFMHDSIDRHVNIYIQSSSYVLHIQQDLFPP
jgi:hypothetical protein